MKSARPGVDEGMMALREGMGRMDITSRGSVDLMGGIGSKEGREGGRGREVSHTFRAETHSARYTNMWLVLRTSGRQLVFFIEGDNG